MVSARPFSSFSSSCQGFRGRTAVLATMHGKEAVIAPPLQSLGVTVTVLPEFNSDRFGTFTREIDRLGTQQEAARRKAEAAAAQAGLSLALASEGAFFPHPALPWAACDRELVLLLDLANGLEIVGEVLSTQTNYAHKKVASVAEAIAFAETVGFPAHGLVAMPRSRLDNPANGVKGICTEADLVAAIERLLQHHSQVHLETDMRAMHNPSRMQVIAQATQDLVNKLHQVCPQCGCPGFAVSQKIPGLPCRNCGSPTLLPYAEVYECQRCHHRSLEPLLTSPTADPAQCNYCNP
ncbi:MAG: DUF6671 family protein [Almyronema sp.]